MFNFLKKIAGGGKDGSCGAPACGTKTEASACSSQAPKQEMKGGCCPHDEEDHTAPKGACH